MLATGAVAGVLAGLLGVGGGIVIVPALDFALGARGVDPAIRMHIAVGTSLATIIFTSVSSARAHHARGGVDRDLAVYWGPFIFVGALIGSVLAAQVHSEALALLFGIVAFLVAVKMVLPLDELHPWSAVPRGAGGSVTPTLIGLLSSMLGIGGGTFSVTALTLMSQPIHRAVGTSALFGLLIALPGTLGFVVTGWNDPNVPPGSLGYVNLVGVAAIAPMTILMAPLGAALAHRLSKRQLNLAFGSFLLVVSVRMLWRALL
ncbi:sulfite exporter TauE/SafE family protein [Mangrovimicrobium sediminis]|uniref:Probable membrane transporter protein n=1 Tax=Mangrovimicrobium sediminis TaxID=2562682 RepID=A0A4Z0M3S0_9GAMM|nr:sulfite exporter TauE/SafE family protein [Haliea sp. SAOS-164]TGD74151.1 sulfite exporter TauE/SafE family protein [Haliea sp. SAOS-164]